MLRDKFDDAMRSTAFTEEYLPFIICAHIDTHDCVYISVFLCVLVGLKCCSYGTELIYWHFKGKI